SFSFPMVKYFPAKRVPVRTIGCSLFCTACNNRSSVITCAPMEKKQRILPRGMGSRANRPLPKMVEGRTSVATYIEAFLFVCYSFLRHTQVRIHLVGFRESLFRFGLIA